MTNPSKTLMWVGIALIVITGLIHLIDAPSSFDDATYKGVLFVANGVGAAIAAVGIFRGAKTWGWGLGLLVAGGALVAYIISRTVGLPGLQVDDWGEPLGIASLAAEGLFVVTALYALAASPRNASVRTNSSRITQ